MYKNEITVDHPDYGYVIFSMMSVRQLEVLKEYEKLKKKYDKKIKTPIH